jgi:hypothetical protein
MTDLLVALAFIAMVLLPGIVAGGSRDGSVGNGHKRVSR